MNDEGSKIPERSTSQPMDAIPPLQEACEVVEARGGELLIGQTVRLVDTLVEDDAEEREEEGKNGKALKRKNRKRRKPKKTAVIVNSVGQEGDLPDDIYQKEEGGSDHENEPTSSSASSGSGEDHEIVLGENITQPGDISVTPLVSAEDSTTAERRLAQSGFDTGSKHGSSLDDAPSALESIPMIQQDSHDTCESRSEQLKTPPNSHQDLPDLPSIVVQSPSNVSRCSERTYVSFRDDSSIDSPAPKIEVEAKEVTEIISMNDTHPPEILQDYQDNPPTVEAPKTKFQNRLPLIFGSLSPSPVSWNVRPPPNVRSRQQFNKSIHDRVPHTRVVSLPHPLTLPTSHHPQPASLLIHRQPTTYHANTSASTPQGYLFACLPLNPSRERCHPLSSSWTLFYSNTLRALRQPPSLPIFTTSNADESIPKASAADSYSHGLVTLFTASSLENLLGSYKALRRGIAERKGRAIEPIGMKIAKGDAGLGMPWMDDDSNFHIFRDGVRPMWEDEMCAMGGKIMMTGNPKEVGPVATLSKTILEISPADTLPEFRWTNYSST